MTERELLQIWLHVSKEIPKLLASGNTQLALKLYGQLIDFLALFLKFKLACQQLEMSLSDRT